MVDMVDSDYNPGNNRSWNNWNNNKNPEMVRFASEHL